MSDSRADLAAATKQFERTAADHEKARAQVIDAIVRALRDGVGPTEVERLSPFTGTYIRKLARENAVPPAAVGRKPQRRK